MDDVSGIDKMHYIVDGNGNYYRINRKNQLVVANGREEAGVFSYVEANQRIGGGRKAHFYSVIPIELQEDGEGIGLKGAAGDTQPSPRNVPGDMPGFAQPIPENVPGDMPGFAQPSQGNVPSDMPEGAQPIPGHVQGDRPGGMLFSSKEMKTGIQGNLLPLPGTGNASGNVVPKAAEPPRAGQEFAVYETDSRMSLPYDMGSMDWAEYMTHFCYLVSSIRNYQDELNQALSDLDMQICDIMHYIELYQVGEGQSVWMVRLLKECREQRRDVKDEMLRVEYFQRAIGTNANLIRAKEGISLIKKLESRFYHPRRLKELFKGSHQKTARANKLLSALGNSSCMEAEGMRQAGEAILLPEKAQPEIAPSQQPGTGEDSQKEGYNGRAEGGYIQRDANNGRREEEVGREEDGNMENTRRETIFDGKDNNWREFARMQLEFYANAGQYMQNLQIDLDEIDDEIEQTLREIEEANYNVAQGYKVFKRLKDLRNERKRKQKEWECVGILADEFDCEAMADIMEYCLEEIEAVAGTEPAAGSKAASPKIGENRGEKAAEEEAIEESEGVTEESEGVTEQSEEVTEESEEVTEE